MSIVSLHHLLEQMWGHLGHWWGTLLDVSVRAFLERVSNEKDSHWKWPAPPMAWEPGQNKEGKENASRMLLAQPQVGDSLCHIWDMPHTHEVTESWTVWAMYACRVTESRTLWGMSSMWGYRIMSRMNHVIHTRLPSHGLNSQTPRLEINSFSLVYDRCFRDWK